MDLGSRHLAGYAGILGVGLAILAVVLPIGRRIEPAATVPAGLEVSGSATGCLGRELAVRQSGIYLDLHVAVVGDAEATAGRAQVASGRIDRATQRVMLHGSCAPGTAHAGQDHRFQLDVGSLRHRAVESRVAVGSDGALTATIDRRRPSSRDPGGSEPLRGTELAGRVFLAAAVVIVTARAAGSLFRRLRQPAVVGEVVGGIVLGPSVVGALLPDLTELLFPADVVQVLGVLAQFGLIFFMFLIGLELDLEGLSGSSRTAITVSHVSIVAPFVLGVTASLLLFPLLGNGDFASFALFMGAAMSITAFPVLARILTDTGLQRTKLGALAITCAAVDDVTAWCVLSVVVAMAQAAGPAEVVRTVGFSLVFVVVVLGVLRPALSRRLAARSDPTDGADSAGEAPPGPVLGNETITALIALVLVGAWITEEIGIHAIFGAFLVGVALPRDRGVVGALTAKLGDVTSLVLLPLFFVVAGLSTRIGLLDSPLMWAITAFVIAVAVVGKWAGSTFAARACGMPWSDAVPLGVLMNTRGLTEIVIVTIGLELGVISPALFTVMVLMALATTVMTVPVLTKLRAVPVVFVRPLPVSESRPAAGDGRRPTEEAR